MLYDIVFEGVHVENVYTTPELLDEYMESAYGAVRDWYAAIPGEHHFFLSDDRGTDVIAYEVDEVRIAIDDMWQAMGDDGNGDEPIDYEIFEG